MRPAGTPRMVIRVNADDGVWEDCEVREDETFPERAFMINCKEKCIKPKSAEICKIDPYETDAEEFCKKNWKKLRFK